MIGILELRTENYHYTVLQEVIELYGIRVEALALQIMDPKERCGLMMTASAAKPQGLTLSQNDQPENR